MRLSKYLYEKFPKASVSSCAPPTPRRKSALSVISRFIKTVLLKQLLVGVEPKSDTYSSRQGHPGSIPGFPKCIPGTSYAHTYINIVTFILFLKSLDYNDLPHDQRVSHGFWSLLRCLLSPRSSRACFSRATLFFPGTRQKQLSEKEKVHFVFPPVWHRLSFAFFSPAR